MPDKDMTLVFRALIITAMLAVLAFVYVLVEASEAQDIPRWNIDNRRDDWRRYDDLPELLYAIEIRPECHGNRFGDCGELLMGLGYIKATGFDLQTGRKIEFIENANGCYFKLFQYDYGEDGNPHFDLLIWVDCEKLNEILWG